MKEYVLGLNVDGTIQFVLRVLAKDFRSASYTWAHLTNHLDPLFNINNQTYFGWKIVKTDLISLQRKSEMILFKI